VRTRYLTGGSNNKKKTNDLLAEILKPIKLSKRLKDIFLKAKKRREGIKQK